MRRQNPNPLVIPRHTVVLPRPIYVTPISQIPDKGDYGTSLSDLSDSSNPVTFDQNTGSTADIMPPDNSSQLFPQ